MIRKSGGSKNGLLPKLVFIFLTVVLDITKAILNKLQAIVNKFIWNNKKPRIKLSKVEKRLQNGGLAIPNIKKILLRSHFGCMFGIVEYARR